jgi:hypothetical protein
MKLPMFSYLFISSLFNCAVVRWEKKVDWWSKFENSVEPDWMTFQDGFAFLLESREKFESSLGTLMVIN